MPIRVSASDVIPSSGTFPAFSVMLLLMILIFKDMSKVMKVVSAFFSVLESLVFLADTLVRGCGATIFFMLTLILIILVNNPLHRGFVIAAFAGDFYFYLPRCHSISFLSFPASSFRHASS